ncbi:MAG: activator of HSP90 ATPase [Crocinitomicaceae bacterium]|jgi:activator of HSP90 ATPase
MKISFEVKENFSVKPTVIYRAWLDSEGHSSMTGGDAICSDEADGAFSAWDGYIFGKNSSLVENQEIVQLWRTTEFEEEDEDSLLQIVLRETEDGCEVTIKHSNIPEDRDADYEQGWKEHYFSPMKEYFS